MNRNQGAAPLPCQGREAAKRTLYTVAEPREQLDLEGEAPDCLPAREADYDCYC